MIFFSDSYTVEGILEGHPDKVCDQICDAILDEYLSCEKKSKVAVECIGTGNSLVIGGEISSNAEINVGEVANNIYKKIGYEDNLTITNIIQKQPDQLNKVACLSMASDQGVMYGYACQNSHNYLPFGIWLANSISREIDFLRKETNLYLPDGKIQLTINNGTLKTIILNVQQNITCNQELVKNTILEKCVKKFVPDLNGALVFFNNHSDFIQGGFLSDTGLSGRKIITDTYCGLIPHGGGAFSGKDPSKVDRSASYMARFVAKNIVANKLAKWCLVAVAYVFGNEKPVMLQVKTNKTANGTAIKRVVDEKFDFRPKAIIERLNLYNTKYRPTSIHGHFSDASYEWEKIVSI